MIFSGSAVFDARNTSGLGRPDAPPMVAVYTGHGRRASRRRTSPPASIAAGPGRSSRATRCSTSARSSSATRRSSGTSPRPDGSWRRSWPTSGKVRLWGSADLKRWEKLSDFGPAGSTKGVWECPELFEAPVEGGKPGESRWVLKVDVNDGAPFGGSGGQYFVGRFDGKEFRPEESEADAPPLWIDHGKDFYASQAWNDAPGDGRPVWIAWMNNWQYANEIPTSPWRGAMTVPAHGGAPQDRPTASAWCNRPSRA